MDSHCGLIRASLSPEGLRSLVPAPPKNGTSWPIFFHHDNAIAHPTATTVDFLNESEVLLLLYPSYSPDLSPCDFCLVPELKKQLKGTLFDSVEDVCRTFTRAVEDIRKSTKAEEWNKWFHHMAKCRAAEGRFFEKMK